MPHERQLDNRSVTSDHVFRTRRLLVRKWVPADEPRLLQLYSIPKVIRWIDDGNPLSASEAALWMDVTCRNYCERGYGMFAIETLQGTGVIAFGGLVHPGGQAVPEVKYAFYPDFWGNGFATEFVKGLLNYARCGLDLTKVIATVSEENVASQNVLSKSGFWHSETRTEIDGSRTQVYETGR